MKAVFEKIKERLEEASWNTMSTFDEDGYSNDDSEEVITLDKAIEIVNQVESECNNGWIPCSERLPEETDSDYWQILYLTTKHGDVVCGFYRNDDKEWYVFNDAATDWKYVPDGYIIAWKEFPEPYKGE